MLEADLEELHNKLVVPGLELCSAGSIVKASERFAEAYPLTLSTATLISWVNMKLRLGEISLAVAVFRLLLTDPPRELMDAERE